MSVHNNPNPIDNSRVNTEPGGGTVDQPDNDLNLVDEKVDSIFKGATSGKVGGLEELLDGVKLIDHDPATEGKLRRNEDPSWSPGDEASITVPRDRNELEREEEDYFANPVLHESEMGEFVGGSADAVGKERDPLPEMASIRDRGAPEARTEKVGEEPESEQGAGKVRSQSLQESALNAKEVAKNSLSKLTTSLRGGTSRFTAMLKSEPPPPNVTYRNLPTNDDS